MVSVGVEQATDTTSSISTSGDLQSHTRVLKIGASTMLDDFV
jgi:hypothetical protein